MGTYTANKNLYMPTVGEQGWGTLMNTNLSTIDNFLKPITESGGTYTFTGNHVGNQSGGTITATKITNSGTLTQTGTSTFTGKITANGGIGTKALTATSISNSGTLTQTGTSTFTGKITANGGVNDYEERITKLEAGEFNGEVSAETFNGALCVNVTSVSNNTLGTYTVVPDKSSGNLSVSVPKYGTVSGPTFKINSISYNIKTGFKPINITTNITVTVSILPDSFNVCIYVYLNGTQVGYWADKDRNESVSTTISVKSGDTITTKFYNNYSPYSNSTIKASASLSNMSGSLYLA